MFDAARWSQLISGHACPLCSEPGSPERRVVELPSGPAFLQDDAAFRGYCILVHRRHVTELHQLSPEELRDWATDVARLARAIAAVCHPAKLNYEVLGNEVPHLHCHVVPRYANDGCWGRPIWLRPREERRALPPGECQALRDALRQQFTPDD
ncbi:MAG: HIT family protein [Phycisphaerae bacterium]